MNKIKDLSKEELLSLIYNNFTNTFISDHPCECSACGTRPDNEVKVGEYTARVYWYICDKCENDTYE